MLLLLYFDLLILGPNSEKARGNGSLSFQKCFSKTVNLHPWPEDAIESTVDGLTTALPYALFTASILVMLEASSGLVASHHLVSLSFLFNTFLNKVARGIAS